MEMNPYTIATKEQVFECFRALIEILDKKGEIEHETLVTIIRAVDSIISR